MKEYNLGPNGAILTSLNLFATRFDQARGGLAGGSMHGERSGAALCAQHPLPPSHALLDAQVIDLCCKSREPPLEYVLVDTPGQIEIFTWSASGAIITEAFATMLPTAVVFVVDTPRCTSPQTFMANMLQVIWEEGGPLLRGAGEPPNWEFLPSEILLPCRSAPFLCFPRRLFPCARSQPPAPDPCPSLRRRHAASCTRRACP